MDSSHTSDVKPSMISRYLKARGWSEDTLNSDQSIFIAPDQEFEVLIDRSTSEESVRKNVYFAVRTISDYYEMGINNARREILSHLSDRISGSIPTRYVKDDSIDFAIAAEYMAGIRKMLSASASTVLTGERYFKRTLKEAAHYADKCRFGHTFRGSFGFVVESPLPENTSPTFEGIADETPLGRKVIERISKGFVHIERASTQQDMSFITSEESGLSSNMLDSVADIFEETAVDSINFAFKFSMEWATDAKAAHIKQLKISSSDVSMFREASQLLRPKEDEFKQETIFGRVRKLETDGNPRDLDDDSSSREVEIIWLAEDDKPIKVRIKVTPQEYRVALQAHEAGKILSVRGILPASGKTRVLREPSGLTILG